MPSKQKAPEGASHKTGSADEMDTEGHARTRTEPEPVIKATDPDTGASSNNLSRIDASEDDVEGHNFAPNAMLSRNAATSRERDIQRNLQKHDAKTEAKRPFFKK
jgi:hypothetical protein